MEERARIIVFSKLIQLLRWLSLKNSIGEDVEKLEPLYTVGDTVNCCTAMENSMEFTKKLNLELLCHLAVLLLNIHSKELTSGSKRYLQYHLKTIFMFTDVNL